MVAISFQDVSGGWIFIAALLSYLIILLQHVNEAPVVGMVEIYSNVLGSLISAKSRVEVVSTGYKHLDGILWIDDEVSASSYVLATGTRKRVRANNILYC